MLYYLPTRNHAVQAILENKDLELADQTPLSELVTYYSASGSNQFKQQLNFFNSLQDIKDDEIFGNGYSIIRFEADFPECCLNKVGDNKYYLSGEQNYDKYTNKESIQLAETS